MALLHRFWSTDRSLTLLLALLGIVIFVITPLGDLGVTGGMLMSVGFSLVLLSGVGAVAKRTLTTALMGGLVLVSLVIHWLKYWLYGGWLALPDALSSSLLCVVLAVIVLVQVFREGPITSQRVQGAVAVYLLLGLAWAFVYEAIALHSPLAFTLPAAASTNSGEDLTPRFVYFSFVTLTTVGYGDITAVHPVARSLATAEALVGQLFPAILLARLVSMELYYQHEKRDERR